MQTPRRELLKLAGGGIAASLMNSHPLQADSVKVTGAAQIGSVFPVRRFGAAGDGTTIDTPAVNRAIDAAASAGGGVVHFSAGTYACYSIHLKSNVTLFLDQGATILAAEQPAEGASGGYDAPEPDAPWHAYQDFG
ncbi:MAG TPA: glycosyl hydrolase family 28-related protein, partial [Acidobacteriaceae bacterium]|nr:glycosyl hydrolase family 28-related protein [Acidobacteriaceae bacterium]